MLVIKNKWIQDNLDDLYKAGFTDEDLFSNMLPIGIDNMGVWMIEGLKPSLEKGVINFRWLNKNNGKIIQTARPRRKNGTR